MGKVISRPLIDTFIYATTTTGRFKAAEVAKEIEVDVSTASRHLRTLKSEGIVDAIELHPSFDYQLATTWEESDFAQQLLSLV
jgi:predicted transcriptional regulator